MRTGRTWTVPNTSIETHLFHENLIFALRWIEMIPDAYKCQTCHICEWVDPPKDERIRAEHGWQKARCVHALIAGKPKRVML